jgi:tripartite-type tricarboxylate transporter receptor subunit TctC
LAPAKTPKEIIATIHGAAVTVLKDPLVSRRLTDLGYVSVGDQPEEFAAFIKAEIATLAKIVKQTGATAE